MVHESISEGYLPQGVQKMFLGVPFQGFFCCICMASHICGRLCNKIPYEGATLTVPLCDCLHNTSAPLLLEIGRDLPSERHEGSEDVPDITQRLLRHLRVTGTHRHRIVRIRLVQCSHKSCESRRNHHHIEMALFGCIIGIWQLAKLVDFTLDLDFVCT